VVLRRTPTLEAFLRKVKVLVGGCVDRCMEFSSPRWRVSARPVHQDLIPVTFRVRNSEFLCFTHSLLTSNTKFGSR
jgi:hypothetical protein